MKLIVFFLLFLFLGSWYFNYFVLKHPQYMFFAKSERATLSWRCDFIKWETHIELTWFYYCKCASPNCMQWWWGKLWLLWGIRTCIWSASWIPHENFVRTYQCAEVRKGIRIDMKLVQMMGWCLWTLPYQEIWLSDTHTWTSVDGMTHDNIYQNLSEKIIHLRWLISDLTEGLTVKLPLF